MAVPELDAAALLRGDAAAVCALRSALEDCGFFTLARGAIDPSLLRRLEDLARDFFALPEAEKQEVRMALGGKAWRGYFPLGAELTSGKPDGKAGLYFGTDDDPDDARPLHGRNLWPRRPPGLKEAVGEYMTAATELARGLMRSVALALELEPDFWERTITHEPTVLFRIFNYPDAGFDLGVGEHTDYGLLTVLCVDASGGLQVRAPEGHWLDVPPPPPGENALVVNIGDMLERLSGGRFRSTPHRVVPTGTNRVSFPLFYDPGWGASPSDALAELGQRLGAPPAKSAGPRWDGQDLSQWHGTHGEYLQAKVQKCFPDLFAHAVAED